MDIKDAKEAYREVRDAWSENHKRMLEDLDFSNPADPQQWPQDALQARGDRVCLTMDRSNQYIVQVVNQARMNKPSINTMPVDSKADPEVATVLDGVFRHIEYRSRAQIAYDWSIEGAARCGVGWLRPIPRMINTESEEQEICIERVADHLACVIDGEMPDGSDAMNGFAETMITQAAFKREYPNAKAVSWGDDMGSGWIEGDKLRLCEWQYVEEKQTKAIVIVGPDGRELEITEDQYSELSQRLGFAPEQVRKVKRTKRVVKWCKFTGAEILEETLFPGQWIGMVPVIGYEAFVNGKRYLCGMTRRLMDAQRAYNYERSAMVEAIALQPKAPVMVPVESVEGHEDHWDKLNKGQPAYLPYNALDPEGKQFPSPTRLAPPMFPAAFAQGGQIAIADLEAALGMFQSNLGQPNNATSGRQERERKQQGGVATFHFADNQARSLEHLGRIIVGMIPTIYSTKRQAKIIGIDGQQSDVIIDPKMPQAAVMRGRKVVAINPTVGAYDVRVKTGPNYTTQREEAAEGIQAVLQAAPAFTPALAPSLVKLRDWPESEKVSRMLLAMAPPEVQAIANEGAEDEEQPLPPQVQQALQKMQQQGQQMSQMLDAAEKELERLQIENEKLKAQYQIKTAELAARTESDESNEQINRYRAQTDRWKVLTDALAKGVLPLPGFPMPPPIDTTTTEHELAEGPAHESAEAMPGAREDDDEAPDEDMMAAGSGAPMGGEGMPPAGAAPQLPGA